MLLLVVGDTRGLKCGLRKVPEIALGTLAFGQETGRIAASPKHRVIEEWVTTPAASSREPLGDWPRLAVSVAREVTTATFTQRVVYADIA